MYLNMQKIRTYSYKYQISIYEQNDPVYPLKNCHMEFCRVILMLEQSRYSWAVC